MRTIEIERVEVSPHHNINRMNRIALLSINRQLSPDVLLLKEGWQRLRGFSAAVNLEDDLAIVNLIGMFRGFPWRHLHRLIKGITA